MRGSEGPHLKILDFGIALQRGAIGDAAGTLEYMAPEVLLGQPPTPASDLFAVGVMFYQMLTKQFPYNRTSMSRFVSDMAAGREGQVDVTVPPSALDALACYSFTSESHLTPDPAQLRLLAEAQHDEHFPLPLVGVDARVGAIITRLLTREPSLRYQDAGEVLSALSDVMGEIAARPLTPDTAAGRESFLQAAVLVGRDRELGQLQAALTLALESRGQMVLLGGESGIGKSRLVEELRTLALVRGVLTLRGQAVSSGGSAHQLFEDVLPAMALELELNLADEEAAVLKELVPELPELLGRTIPDAPQLGPLAAQQRLRRMLLSLLTRRAEPILLLLEDIHWAAPESLALLKDLSAAAATRPLLLVATYRDDERPEFVQSLPDAEVMKLCRLPPEDVAALSISMLGKAGSHPELLALLNRETEGNVFFIVEVVRALAEEAGSLETVGVRELPSQVFAGGIQSVIQRRLNRVPDWARPLLRTAAIAGRQIDTVLFRALDPGLDHWLQVSLEASVLEVSDTQWRFAHDKLRESLLASMDAAEQRRLHRQVGEALERVHGPTDAQAAMLAYHFEQAGEWSKAARFATQAGAGSLRRGALHEAVKFLTRAEALQQQIGAPPHERAVTLRRLSRALFGAGQPEECVRQVHRAMALLGRPLPKQRGKRMLSIVRELGIELRHRVLGPKKNPDAQSRVIAKELLALTKGTGDALFGRIDEALFVMLISLHAAELIGDVEQQINYVSWLGYAAFVTPIHPLGRAYFGIAEKLLAEHPELWEHSGYQPNCGYYKHAEGKWQESLDAYTRWLQAVQSSGDSPLQCLALSSRCAAQLNAGRFDDALQDSETCYRAAKRLGNEHYLGGSLGVRALVYLYRDDPVQSAQLFTTALEHMEKSASPIYKLSGVGSSSLAALQSGDFERARAQTDLALQRMRRTQAPAPGFYDGYAGVAEVALHFLLAATSESERAAAALRMRKALYQLARFGLAFPIGRSRFFNVAGRLLWHRGQRQLALAFLAKALQSARTYSMQYEEAFTHLWRGRLGSSSDGKMLVSAADTADSLRTAVSIFRGLGSPASMAEAEQLLNSR